ncbi:uncharacterized protein LOC131232665 [Magnolia sinica]|uniref:uncharacterized protein LOC131232665 n=1 Tax=Magnolia sinica TaxID=86752 RepID=UPI00265A6584|nr:uncharacterized protein LOC131232665 [Magnolia sinica]
MSSPSLPTIHAPQSKPLAVGRCLGLSKRIDASGPEENEAVDIDTFDLFGPTGVGIELGGDDGTGKLKWLKTQIIGANAEFDSPFGCRCITYSDHTASGRFLRAVEEFLERDVLQFYGNTHTVDSYVGLHTSKLVHESCQYIKRCMGAGPHDVLLFCGTGSTAAIKRLQEVMGVAVPSIMRSRVMDCLTLSERWVVFTGPYEHHSNLLSWRHSLTQVVEIRLSESGLIDVGSLAAALESPEYSGRPKLGSFSACSNVTGIYTDTRAIARVLHEHGAFACFDFACSGPYINIEMKSGELDGYDAVFLSPHKFIGGPGSPGILVMSDALYRLKDAPPSTSGGGTVRYVNGYSDQDTLYCEDLEEREDAGTPGIVQKIRAAIAFRVKHHMGHELIRAQESLLMSRASERLLKNPNVHVLGNTCAERQPIVSFLVYPESAPGKHLHCRFVTKLLNDLFGIQARGGCACAAPYGHVLLGVDRARSQAIRSAIQKGYEGLKPGWTRVSFSYYTAVEEMEFVIDAIEFIATYGNRFLPLYHFDWKTGDWSFLDSTSAAKPTFTETCTSSQENDPTCKDIGVKYMEYMEAAKHTAETLSNHPEEQPCPEYIDPKLVTFRI